MAIKRINIGQVANDGTGDDLREAFVKVNDNFTELDTRVFETTTASNLGSAGEGVFKQLSGSDLQFKKLIGGSNITIDSSEFGLTINTSETGLDNFRLVADNGAIQVETDGQNVTIAGGANVTTTASGNTITIASQTSLVTDQAPRLGADLQADDNDIIMGEGSVVGDVHGIDIRTHAGIQDYIQGLDFGNFLLQADSFLAFEVMRKDINFGAPFDSTDPGFAEPAHGVDLDFGTFVGA